MTPKKLSKNRDVWVGLWFQFGSWFEREEMRDLDE